MPDDMKDYLEKLNQARSRRKKQLEIRYFVAAVCAVVVVSVLGVGLARMKSRSAAASGQEGKAGQEGTAASETETETEAPAEPTLSPEELAAQQEAQEIQAVLDSYGNMGLIQVEGYLNVRETPGSGGKIIGKLQQNSVCEILEEDGEWDHITSGGIEGYIHNQYVVTGEAAKEAARAYVVKRAVIKADKLNIRDQPNTEGSQVVGQALQNERYEVLGEADGWVQIDSGYVSAEFVEVKYALNEARKLDLVAMAINMYDHLVISKVDNYLNVREEPKSDGKVIGKMTSRGDHRSAGRLVSH